MDQPRSIRFFHEQTGKYIGTLDNRGDRRFWGDVHEQDMDGTNFFNFFMPNNIPLAEKIGGRVRVLIPHEETGWQEFVIHSTEDDGTVREVRTDGVEVELNKLKIVEPGNQASLTAYQYVELCTEGVNGYEPGIIEFSGSRTIDRSDPRGAYDYLGMVCTAFDLEMRIRTETDGGYITRRYIDLLERVGKDRALTVEYGKDLVSFRKFINSNEIVTSLYCRTPEREDGTRLYTTVTHAEAFQTWNWQGRHLMGIYEPESDNEDMTLEQLREYGQKALNKLVASIFEYDVEAISVEHLFPHKKARLGDRINVKNTDIEPPIYARARILRVRRSISNETSKRYTIGEVKEYREEDVLRTFRNIQAAQGFKVIRSETEPAGTSKALWIKPKDPVNLNKPEVAHTYNSTTQAWEKTSATQPYEIGAVDTQDYNGDTIATLINDPGVTVQIVGNKVNLVGAVTVLSDITGNLGTITAGKISLLQMTGQDKKIIFGDNVDDFEGRIDYDGEAMRFQGDSSTYVKVNKGGLSGTAATNVTRSAVVQLYVAGSPIFNFGTLEDFNHRTLQAGPTRLKFLNGDYVAIQARNAADTSHIPLEASEFTVNSLRETKKNIEDYDGDALALLLSTEVKRFHLLDDSDTELKRVGLIYDEVPADIANVAGNGVDLYSMGSLNWKAVQQLHAKHDAEMTALKIEIEAMKQAISELQGGGS